MRGAWICGGVILTLVGSPPSKAEVKTVLDPGKAPLPAETRVWSPLFQAGWDQLNKEHGGLPERVVPANPVITKLDKFQWDEKAVMPNGDYAIYSGPATARFAREVAGKVKKRFGWDMELFEGPEIDGGKAVYGILVRDLQFQRSFFRSKKKPLEFQDGKGKKFKVSFFGTVGQFSDRYGKTVSVLSHNRQTGAFVMQIATKREGDSLVICRPEKAMSFAEGIEEVLAAKATPLNGTYGSLKDGSLHRYDVVKIPYLTLDTNADLTPLLKGVRHYPGNPVTWQIGRAYQKTRFELFEKGARVRVETGASDDPFGGPPKRPKIFPRNFVCDRPFFVFIWRDGAKLPYFAAWIDGPDALEKFR